MDKRYRYAGDGLGVPGLPHEITTSQAVELGVDEILRQAAEAGVYVEIPIERPATVRMPRSKSAAAAGPSDEGGAPSGGKED